MTSSTPAPYTATRATVVVGFAEALSAPEVVWSLVDDGFKVIAFARKGRMSPLRYSRHVEIHEICAPESNLEEAKADLRALLVSLGTGEDREGLVLLPLDDKAVYLSSTIELDGGWRLAGPEGGSADLALNKNLQVEAARDAGFNVPKTLLLKSADDILKSSADLSFPIILRPAECVPTHQGRLYKCRNWVCATDEELKTAVSQWAERVPLLAQPFIEGEGEGVFGLVVPDGIRAWSAHRRLRMMNPHGSGSSACISQPVPAEIKQKAEALLKSVNWRGMFMIELLRDHSGNLWFVELNGRPWGSMALSRRQGLEYPAWQVRLAMDQQSSVGAAPPSLHTGLVCRNVGRELMHLLFVLKGAKSKALTNWPSFWSTLMNVLRIRKGDAFYNWRSDDQKVFVADCYCTMHDNLCRSRI
jgi:predicted ATP-grasp superfamily ATP-dependent carboligase